MHYLTEYRRFQTKHELNEAVNAHLSAHKYNLIESDRAVLLVVSRHSVKYGAAHLKAGTIAKVIGKSEKTARRALAKLAELGIVKKIATTRKVNGGKGANIIVILPYDQSNMTGGTTETELTRSKAESPKNENEPFLSSKQKTYNHSNVNAVIPGVPKTLQYYKAFFGKHLRTLWFRVNFAFKKLKIEVDKETREDIGRTTLEALKSYIISNKQLADEELNKLAYRIAYNQIEQRMNRGELEDLTNFWPALYVEKRKKTAPPVRPYEAATLSELHEMGVF